jgi:hypothetical protein
MAKAKPEKLRVSFRSSEFAPTIDPPDFGLLQKLYSRFNAQLRPGSVCVLNKNPTDILSSMMRVNKFCATRKGKKKTVLRNLINYMVEFGGLIITNDPDNVFLFDHAQFRRLMESTKRREIPIIPHDLTERAHQLLEIKFEEEETPEKTETTTEPQTGTAPKAITANMVREIVIQKGDESFAQLIEEYPHLETLPTELGILALYSVKRRETELQDSVFALSVYVEELVRNIETQAIDMLLEDGAPEASTAPSSSCDIEAQIRAIRNMIDPIKNVIAEIRQAQAETEEELDTVEVNIIDRMQERLRYTTDADDQERLHRAIARAQEVAQKLQDHLDHLGELLAPYTKRMQHLTSRINAIRLAHSAIAEVELPEIVLPEAPNVDEECLNNWSDINISPPKLDTCQLTEEEKLVLAAYMIVPSKNGKSSNKMEQALAHIGQPVTALLSVAQKLSDHNPKLLNVRSGFGRTFFFWAVKNIELDVTSVIPPEQHQVLRDFFDIPPRTKKKTQTTTGQIEGGATVTLTLKDPEVNLDHLDPNSLTEDEKLVLAIFKVASRRRTLNKVANLVTDMDLLGLGSGKQNFRNNLDRVLEVCNRLTKEPSAMFLRFCGCLKGRSDRSMYAITAPDMVDWIDEFLTPDQVDFIQDYFSGPRPR